MYLPKDIVDCGYQYEYTYYFALGLRNARMGILVYCCVVCKKLLESGFISASTVWQELNRGCAIRRANID